MRPNWTDAVFGEALTHFKLKDFKRAKRCVDQAIDTYQPGSNESKDFLKFIKAMCNKNLGNYNESSEQY